MSRILLLCILFIILNSIASNAQNWSPFHSHRKYLYASSTAEEPAYASQLIVIDTAYQSGNDSVFIFNKKAKNDGHGHFMIGLPGPFGYKVMSNDSVIEFLSPLHMQLFPHRSVGSSWDFDTTNHIAATLTYAGIRSFLGTTDSVKTFTLSSGKEIILSKSHGFILWCDNQQISHYLKGMPGEIGENLPTLQDFFTYEVGDEFLYLITQGFYGHGGRSISKTRVYREILEVLQNTDSIKSYRCFRCKQFEGMGYSQSCKVETITYNLYSDQICTMTSKMLDWWINDTWSCVTDNEFMPVRAERYENGPFWVLTTGDSFRYFTPDLRDTCSSTYNNYTDYTSSVGVGLGNSAVYNFQSQLSESNIYESSLIGVNKTNYSAGERFNRVDFVHQFFEWVAIMPNPGESFVNFIFDTKTQWPVQFTAFEFSGRQVLSQTIHSKEESSQIDISTLPYGAYIFHFKDANRIAWNRFMKN